MSNPALAQAPKSPQSDKSSSVQAPDAVVPAAAVALVVAAKPVTAVDRAVTASQLQSEIEELTLLQTGKLPQHSSLPTLFETNLADEAAVKARIIKLEERLAALPNSPPATDIDINRLRVARDRLRLAFLKLPLEQRNSLREQDRLQHEGRALEMEQKSSAAALEATEQARDQALAAARIASAGAEQALATEEARLLTYLSELAALRQSWAQDDQLRLQQERELLARYASVDNNVELKTRQADALYLAIQADLKKLRTAAAKDLDALNAGSAVQPLSAGLDLNDPVYAGHAVAAEKIRELYARSAREAKELQVRESNKRYADTNEVMAALSVLQARRISLFRLLSPAVRDQVTGLSPGGFERVMGEVSHVGLMARWYPVQRKHDAQSFASLLHNVFTAGQLGIEVLGFLMCVAAIFFARRHSLYWFRQIRAWLSSRVQPVKLMLRVDRMMQMLNAMSYELLFLFIMYVLFNHVLAARRDMPELDTLARLAYAYAWYLLVLAFFHRVLLVAVSRYREVSPALNAKILASLRHVTRFFLFFAVYLILAKALLGRGALYDIAKDAAVIGGLLVAWRLIRDWRTEVTQSYLKLYDTGRLADLVRGSQGRSYGLLIAVAAFVIVAARGLWTWVRDIALGFEQTRKALAYIFRRQLERQSKNQTAGSAPEDLPEALQAALSEDPSTADLSIDHFPELPGVLTLVDDMSRGKPGAFIALTGERGSGKTSWLLSLQRSLGDMPCTLHTLETRILQPEQVCHMLCDVLGIEQTSDENQLISQTLQAPAQVVMLDLCQNLMLRTVGGLAGYQLLNRVAQATMGKVLWVVAYARWPFEYLQHTHPGRDVYDQIIYLRAWSEPQISELINTRMQAAGFTADYDQLRLNVPAVSSVVRSAPDGGIERVMDRYHRLIWDYSDGNPRVALHFFRLSLDWALGTHVKVRLFAMPSMNDLEDYEARTRFVLASVVQHENITIEEAAESLRFPVAECARALQMLTRYSILVCGDYERYRVSCHWSGAVMRFLKRNKLLVV